MKITFVVLAFFLIFPVKAATQDPERILDRVADYHGGIGPWAVTGYRMGQRILSELGISKRNDFALEVTHRSPKKVQYSCIMDGIAASTGASMGKMNLNFEEAGLEKMETVATNRNNGKRITIRLLPDFAKSITNVPEEQHRKVSLAVLAKEDAEMFTVEKEREPTPTCKLICKERNGYTFWDDAQNGQCGENAYCGVITGTNPQCTDADVGKTTDGECVPTVEKGLESA